MHIMKHKFFKGVARLPFFPNTYVNLETLLCTVVIIR